MAYNTQIIKAKQLRNTTNMGDKQDTADRILRNVSVCENAASFSYLPED